MRKTTFAILLLSATTAALTAGADDHFDSPSVSANPMADAAGLYAWTSSDGTKLNLILTVSPVDDGSLSFGPSVVYVFHVSSHAAYGSSGTETKIVCKFQSNTSHACWVGSSGYVAGDASVTSGITSADGKIRLFAGRRSDPMFWNLGGFRKFVSTIKAIAGTLTFNPAGCPTVDTNTATSLRSYLNTPPTTASSPCAANANDCFIPFDVKAIVMQVDLSLLNMGSNKVLSVWASTHSAT